MSAPPPNLGLRHVRRRWLAIIGLANGAVLVAGLVGLPALLMKRHEAVLDTARATLIRRRPWRYRPVPVVPRRGRRPVRGGREGVRGAPDGRQRQRLPTGSTIEVVYDPEEPGHAKPVHGWSPSYEELVILALVVLGLGAVETTRRAVLTLRILVTGRRAGTTASMWAESFETTPWWRMSSAAWVALWPAEADPWAVRPQLYVPIEDPGAAIVLEAPVSVMGRPAPRGFVVILHGDRAVWPRGRARPEPPLGAAVDDRP